MNDEMELESVAEAIEEAGFGVAAVRVRQALREIEALKKEIGFARVAYDQLVARMDQEIERTKGGMLSACQLDAQRYRWLINNADYEAPKEWPHVALVVDRNKIRFTALGWDEKIHAAIDNAMLAQGIK